MRQTSRLVAPAIALALYGCGTRSGLELPWPEGKASIADAGRDAPVDPAPGDSTRGDVDDVEGASMESAVDAAEDAPIDAPREAAPDVGPVAQLALGAHHTCALLTDGTVKCWGDNLVGELGDGTTTNRVTPTAVLGLSGVAEIALGRGHTCARLFDRTVECWGNNSVGQLGDGTTTNRVTPTAVLGLSDVAKIALGDRHSCALLVDGRLRCWGMNKHGQVGDGTRESRWTATLIPTKTWVEPSRVTDIALGDEYTCARFGDSTLQCWGYNEVGELGDGTRTMRLAPTYVNYGVIDLMIGGSHTVTGTTTARSSAGATTPLAIPPADSCSRPPSRQRSRALRRSALARTTAAGDAPTGW